MSPGLTCASFGAFDDEPQPVANAARDTQKQGTTRLFRTFVARSMARPYHGSSACKSCCTLDEIGWKAGPMVERPDRRRPRPLPDLHRAFCGREPDVDAAVRPRGRYRVVRMEPGRADRHAARGQRGTDPLGAGYCEQQA